MVKTVPAPHTLDQNPVWFRVTSLRPMPEALQPLAEAAQLVMHVEYPRIGQSEDIGLTGLRLQPHLAALQDAIQTQGVYWADFEVPPFPASLSYDFLDRLFSALEKRQFVDTGPQPE